VGLPGHDLGEGRYPALARVVRLLAEGDFTTAFTELNSLITSDDPDLRPRAVLLLGRIYVARGDMPRALEAFGIAASSGHPEVSPFAWLVLGEAMLGLGMDRPARRLLRRARRANDPETRRLADEAMERLPVRRRWWHRETRRP
jgi:hypothetical protein